LNDVPPNQRLKLTEIAACFCAARELMTTETINRYVRAVGYNRPAAFRRSLAAIR